MSHLAGEIADETVHNTIVVGMHNKNCTHPKPPRNITSESKNTSGREYIPRGRAMTEARELALVAPGSRVFAALARDDKHVAITVIPAEQRESRDPGAAHTSLSTAAYFLQNVATT